MQPMKRFSDGDREMEDALEEAGRMLSEALATAPSVIQASPGNTIHVHIHIHNMKGNLYTATPST